MGKKNRPGHLPWLWLLYFYLGYIWRVILRLCRKDSGNPLVDLRPRRGISHLTLCLEAAARQGRFQTGFRIPPFYSANCSRHRRPVYGHRHSSIIGGRQTAWIRFVD